MIADSGVLARGSGEPSLEKVAGQDAEPVHALFFGSQGGHDAGGWRAGVVVQLAQCALCPSLKAFGDRRPTLSPELRGVFPVVHDLLPQLAVAGGVAVSEREPDLSPVQRIWRRRQRRPLCRPRRGAHSISMLDHRDDMVPALADGVSGPGPRALQVVRVPIGEPILHPQNARRSDMALLRSSLLTYGQYSPLVGQRSTRYVLRGNHLLIAARGLGWTEIDVVYVDVDDEWAAKIVLIDNRSSDLAGYDTAELLERLQDLPDLRGTGFGQPDLDGLLAEVNAQVPLAEDEAPPLPEEPVTQPGELIVLGEHRLICADARSRRAFERLLQGAPAELLHCDPPYGVGYTGKTKKKLRIQNDSAENLPGLLSEVFANVDRVLAPGAPVYVFHPSGPLALVFYQAFLECGWDLRQGLVWDKGQFVLGRGDHHLEHESIAFGYKRGPGRLGRGGVGWFGGNNQSSVFRVQRPRCSPEHPTTKPVELVAIGVRNSSRPGGLVLDPFGGSGTTLLAAEQLGRRARLIELDGRYCDVIIERWRRLTGSEPERLTADDQAV